MTCDADKDVLAKQLSSEAVWLISKLAKEASWGLWPHIMNHHRNIACMHANLVFEMASRRS
jgi:hypothetical protein